MTEGDVDYRTLRECVRDGLERFKEFRVSGYVYQKYLQDSDVAAENSIYIAAVTPLHPDREFQRLDKVTETFGGAMDRLEEPAMQSPVGVDALEPPAEVPEQ